MTTYNSGKFVVIVDGVQMSYTNYNEIPQIIDNIIMFAPYYIPPPHTDAEHHENAKWLGMFMELKSREIK